MLFCSVVKMSLKKLNLVIFILITFKFSHYLCYKGSKRLMIWMNYQSPLFSFSSSFSSSSPQFFYLLSFEKCEHRNRIPKTVSTSRQKRRVEWFLRFIDEPDFQSFLPSLFSRYPFYSFSLPFFLSLPWKNLLSLMPNVARQPLVWLILRLLPIPKRNSHSLSLMSEPHTTGSNCTIPLPRSPISFNPHGVFMMYSYAILWGLRSNPEVVTIESVLFEALMECIKC